MVTVPASVVLNEVQNHHCQIEEKCDAVVDEFLESENSCENRYSIENCDKEFETI
jgi:hypothetical protein